MFADQPENQIRCGPRQPDHPAAQLAAEIGFDAVRLPFEPRIDLAAVAPRGAPADLVRFHHGCPDAAHRQMKRGRQAGESAADDGNVEARFAFQPGHHGRRCRGFRIDTGR
jgi:hypothetical protein